jgi:hypothetical protein
LPCFFIFFAAGRTKLVNIDPSAIPLAGLQS